MANTNQPPQSKHWADKVAEGILKWQKKYAIKKLHVDDMKTPSGRVHVGALRGVVLHDIIAKVLAEHTDQEIVSTYVFNDMDSVDKIPSYLPQGKYQDWLGKPLYKTPPPTIEESGIDFSEHDEKTLKPYKEAESYAAFYAQDFIEAFRYLGCSQEVVWSHQLYQTEPMQQAIETALNNIDVIKKIYKEIADYALPKAWYPFRAFDLEPEVRSTLTTDWDGQSVTFESKDEKGETLSTNQVNPFDDSGKLLWKVDWPAHWAAMGVTIEGAGKDHTSAGGSRDMANALSKEVFDINPPFDIPYEWILIRGAKMSSSKGVGTSAREFVALFPSEVGRFLFVNKHYNQVIDFDPRTEAIPDLFDEYDQGARIFWGEEEGDQRIGRAFQLSQINDHNPKPHFLPRFRDLAVWMQHPEIDLEEKFTEIKGSALTEVEKNVLEQRVKHARLWIDRYAPEEYQFTPQDDLPEKAGSLSSEQITFIEKIFKLVNEKEWTADDFQQTIFEEAKASLGARQGFQALYLCLLGKTHGPRAAWLILETDRALLQNRIKQLKA